jgi:uncharacterized glyoxalase superfamily protein PhnB
MKFGYVFIWVDDVTRAVEFYEQVFGVKRRFLTAGVKGLYAEMETGETTLAIADTQEAQELFPGGFYANNPSQAPAALQLSFITDDVIAVYTEALQKGATPQMAPETKPWGQTIARLRDPHGILVSIATPMPHFEKQEARA